MIKDRNVVRPYAFRSDHPVNPGKTGVLGCVEVMASPECSYQLTLFTVMREGSLILLLPCYGLRSMFSGEICSKNWANRAIADAVTVGVSYASGVEPKGCDESVPVRFLPMPGFIDDEDSFESVKGVVNHLNSYFDEARWP